MSEFSASEDAGARSRAAHVIHRGRATGDGTGRTHEGTRQQTAKSRSRMCGSATQCSQVNNRVLSRFQLNNEKTELDLNKYLFVQK